jgi:hypothetical protein
MQCNIYGYWDPQSFVFSGSKYIYSIFLWVDFPKMINVHYITENKRKKHIQMYHTVGIVRNSNRKMVETELKSPLPKTELKSPLPKTELKSPLPKTHALYRQFNKKTLDSTCSMCLNHPSK